MEPRSDKILRLLSKALKEQLGSDLKQLILFGSRARGDNAPDSDYDCLAVVTEVSAVTLEVLDQVGGELLFSHDVVFSIVPISEARYGAEKYHPLLMNIAQEGVIL